MSEEAKSYLKASDRGSYYNQESWLAESDLGLWAAAGHCEQSSCVQILQDKQSETGDTQI